MCVRVCVLFPLEFCPCVLYSAVLLIFPACVSCAGLISDMAFSPLPRGLCLLGIYIYVYGDMCVLTRRMGLWTSLVFKLEA